MADVVEFQALIRLWHWEKRLGHRAWLVTGPQSEFLCFWETR